MENVFKEKVRQLTETAIENGLDFTYRPSYNDEVDFPLDFDAEAIDMNTLENPLCVYVSSYLVINLPSDARESEEKYNRYFKVVKKLCEILRPNYIIGAENGIVRELMWCVF